MKNCPVLSFEITFVKVKFSNTQDILDIDENATTALVSTVLKEEGQCCDEISIYYVTTEEICRLHADFFDDPSPTDCISFPIDENENEKYRILGDVFVCPETAIKYCTEHNGMPFDELALYTIHGILHLLGFNDIEEGDRKKMRNAEQRHMASLKAKGIDLRKPSVSQ